MASFAYYDYAEHYKNFCHLISVTNTKLKWIHLPIKLIGPSSVFVLGLFWFVCSFCFCFCFLNYWHVPLRETHIISTSPNGDRTVGLRATNWASQCSFEAYGLLSLPALNRRSILPDIYNKMFFIASIIINLALWYNVPLNVYSRIFNVPQGVLFVVQFATMSWKNITGRWWS